MFRAIVEVPAIAAIGMWFLFQLIASVGSLGGGGGGVAYAAHIGGFIAGMLLIGLFKRPEVRFFTPARTRSWR